MMQCVAFVSIYKGASTMYVTLPSAGKYEKCTRLWIILFWISRIPWWWVTQKSFLNVTVLYHTLCGSKPSLATEYNMTGWSSKLCPLLSIWYDGFKKCLSRFMHLLSRCTTMSWSRSLGNIIFWFSLLCMMLSLVLWLQVGWFYVAWNAMEASQRYITKYWSSK